jgi:hypothetical protein
MLFHAFRKASWARIPGVVLVANHLVNHGEGALAIAGNKLIECRGIAALTPGDEIGLIGQWTHSHLPPKHARRPQVADWTGGVRDYSCGLTINV